MVGTSITGEHWLPPSFSNLAHRLLELRHADVHRPEGRRVHALGRLHQPGHRHFPAALEDRVRLGGLREGGRAPADHRLVEGLGGLRVAGHQFIPEGASKHGRSCNSHRNLRAREPWRSRADHVSIVFRRPTSLPRLARRRTPDSPVAEKLRGTSRVTDCGALQLSQWTAFSPRIPMAIRAMKNRRRKVAGSFNSTIPRTAVPMVAMPVQTA